MGIPIEFSPVMITLLNDPLLTYPIAAALLSGVACGVVGIFVVVKRISNITGSIAHSAFGGIGAAQYLGIPSIVGALVAGWVSGIAMALVRRHFKQNEDILIGMIWVMGMAIGLLMLHFSTGYTSDLFGLLFGNILLITKADIVRLFIWDIAIVGGLIVFFRMLQAVVFDELFATVTNLPVATINYVLISVVAISTILLIKAVGMILVIALITLPAAAAMNLSNRSGLSIVISIGVGIMANLAGIFASFVFDLPVAPIIVLVLMGFYVGSIGVNRVRGAR